MVPFAEALRVNDSADSIFPSVDFINLNLFVRIESAEYFGAIIASTNFPWPSAAAQRCPFVTG
jgi:hypothetical protein